jgi:hypothetical protein
MLNARRWVAVLAYGAPLLLSSPHGSLNERGRLSFAAAQAQTAAPGRIQFYLPPARITLPAPIAAPRPRPSPRPAPAPDPAEALFARLQRQARHAAVRRWMPGLATVSHVGHRLLYRKGYLGDVPVHLVVADLNDPEVKLGVLVARGGVGKTESFASMVQRAQPVAAITGTFFGLKSALPTGDLVVNGHAIYQGFVGTALAFTDGNVVSFVPTHYKEKTAWRFFDGVVRAGPLLVQAGRIAVAPRDEGFTSLSAAARRSRTAVGITPGRKLLLLAVKQPISLWRLAKLMRELGAYHAVAMDGGTSTGLYFGGHMIAQPGRALTNALVVYGYRERYERARSTFLGGAMPPLEARRAPEGPSLRLQIEPLPDNSSVTPIQDSDSSLPRPVSDPVAQLAVPGGSPELPDGTPAASPTTQPLDAAATMPAGTRQ